MYLLLLYRTGTAPVGGGDLCVEIAHNFFSISHTVGTKTLSAGELCCTQRTVHYTKVRQSLFFRFILRAGTRIF